MKKYILLFALILGASACHLFLDTEQTIFGFKNAQKNNDKHKMGKYFSYLLKNKIINIGDKEEKIIDILGEPDNSTGIYIPQGHSIGYGNCKDELEHQCYFWIHFESVKHKHDIENPSHSVLFNYGDL